MTQVVSVKAPRPNKVTYEVRCFGTHKQMEISEELAEDYEKYRESYTLAKNIDKRHPKIK